MKPLTPRSLGEVAGFFVPAFALITISLPTLMRGGDNNRAQSILDDLFNTVEPTPNQAKLIAKAANDAGNTADSYYYMADYYLMNGDLMTASNQLMLALALPNLNAIQRARISALLVEVRAALPKNRKNTVADDNGGRH